MRKTQRRLDAEAGLEPKYRKPFADLAANYRACAAQHGIDPKLSHYGILSDLIRMGWRKSAEPDEEFLSPDEL